MRKDNFYIAIEKRGKGHLKYVKVEGESVENPYGFDFFAHRLRSGFYTISEGVSGFNLLGKRAVCATQEEAIIQAMELIERETPTKLRKIIAICCRRYNSISPRYRNIKKMKGGHYYETIRSFNRQED